MILFVKGDELEMVEAKNNPTVSVVIPTYNRAHLVGRAIQSVLNQTYQDFELIIVDDASTDNTEEMVKSIDDERLRYIRHEENSGTSVAPRNTGIKAARGEYIAFLDSDDEWLPQKLEKQIDKFNSVSSDVGLVCCGYACINGKTGETLREYMPTEGGDVFRLIVERNIPGSPTVLIRKECFKKAGLFDTEFLSLQDWDMWIRIAKYYKFDFIPEVLAKYCVHDKRGSVNVGYKIQGLDRITHKYQNYLSKTVISCRLKTLGILYCYQGDFKKASQYFREAISNNPRNIKAYIHFLLCKLAPRLYQARLRRL